ncbi:MAG TPA: S46 family peptidase [Chthoniobacteraceae bacterium]|nr:S46 family peptidase [Chthoniobacteraceae bacterium]
MATLTAFSDEGMWLYNQPPREILKQRYNFDATQDWLDHLQKSSVRFNSGGSGSFISADGLLITNQHVGADALQKVSSADHDWVKTGFQAHNLAEEMKCVDLELNVLQSIEDVTARVNAAVPKGANPDEAFMARRKIIAEIEKESLDKTGLRSNVITLWKGGAYHLYRFKRYTDVRLVFAPEQQTAFFGGDPDNFEFPRQDLDICILRAYENGKPAQVADYLKVSPTGPAGGDLVFVSGHPGHTNRELTVAELTALRDRDMPFSLDLLKRREVLFGSWRERSIENARRIGREFFGIQNSRKATDGRMAGLLDPDLFGAKVKAENDFKAKLAGNSKYAAALAAYGKIEKATKLIEAQAVRAALLEGGQAFNSNSFSIARILLRAGDERPKPNGERLPEFSDSNKAPLELALFSPKPIYEDMEILKLADSLTYLANELGIEDPLVKKILAGKSPGERAAELINGTKVRDVAFRKQLYDGGVAAVKAANDPMIELARLVDPDSRALRKVGEEQGEVKEEAHAIIEQARHALAGENSYPDATFTLRLSFGTVKGYEENGATVAPFTTFASLYAKAKAANDQPPFNLTPAWKDAESKLNADTPLNFVSTCDIIGGNSGSPVVNRAGEFVGIIFDGNLQSLPWDEVYSDKQGRSISVDSAAILEALEKVYGMNSLVDEMKTGAMTK